MIWDDGWSISFEHFRILKRGVAGYEMVGGLLSGSMALRGVELHDTQSVGKSML